MFLVFGSREKASMGLLGADRTSDVVEYHVQATKARDYDGLTESLAGGEGDLITVLNSSQVFSMDRYAKLLRAMGDDDYIWDDRVLLFTEQFIGVANDLGVEVKVATCDYDGDALGRNALKLRNSVVKLLEGGVVNINKKAPKPTKKATDVEKVNGIE